MAIKDRPTMVRDYWPRYQKRAVILTILMQLAGTLAIGCALLASGVVEPSLNFAIILIAIIAGTLGINLLLINQLLTPRKELTSALTHISGEPTQVTPPTPNARHFE